MHTFHDLANRDREPRALGADAQGSGGRAGVPSADDRRADRRVDRAVSRGDAVTAGRVWALSGIKSRADSALYDAQEEGIRLAEEADRIAEARQENARLQAVIHVALAQLDRVEREQGPEAELSPSDREALGLDLDALCLS